MLLSLTLIYALAHFGTALSTNYTTLLIARFISGFPHGAYFGLATLVAYSISNEQKKGVAVSQVMLGLSFAILIGNPLTVWLGQHFSWRLSFVFIGLVSFFSLILISFIVPNIKNEDQFTFANEISDFNRSHVWYLIAAGAIGCAGLFSVYSYLSLTLVEVTRASDKFMPLLVVFFGVGSILGMLLGGKLSDRWKSRSVGLSFIYSLIVLIIFPFTSYNIWSLIIGTMLIGTMMSMPITLQTQLMSITKEAKNLGAAAIQSALNIANALGPWLAGICLNAGLGYSSPSYVGVIGAAIGIIFWRLSVSRGNKKALSLNKNLN